MTLSEILTKHKYVWQIRKPQAIIRGRNEELFLLEESLSKRRTKSVVLVGKSGCGKTSIVEEFSTRIKDKYEIISMNVSSTIANTKYRGELEEKVTTLVKDITLYNKTHIKKIILFCDEIHTLITGGWEYSLSCAEILKPFLSSGEIIIIGATTFEEYQNSILKDKALARRLPFIIINDLDFDAKLNILEDFLWKEIKDGVVEKDGIRLFLKQFSYMNIDSLLDLFDSYLAKINVRNQDFCWQTLYASAKVKETLYKNEK